MKRYDVACVSCCGVFLKTTEKFDNDKYATGDMFALKRQFKEYGWGSFPEYDSTSHPDIVCPSCGSGYCDDGGKVIRLQETGEFDIAAPPIVTTPDEPIYNEDGRAECPECNKMITRQWWSRHMKAHEAE